MAKSAIENLKTVLVSESKIGSPHKPSKLKSKLLQPNDEPGKNLAASKISIKTNSEYLLRSSVSSSSDVPAGNLRKSKSNARQKDQSTIKIINKNAGTSANEMTTKSSVASTKLPKRVKSKEEKPEFLYVTEKNKAAQEEFKNKDLVTTISINSKIPTMNGGLKSAHVDDDSIEEKEKNRSVVPELTTSERLSTLQDIVAQAELDRRIFCIYDYHRYISWFIRDELLKRGWVECIHERALVPHKYLQQVASLGKPEKPPIDHAQQSIMKSESEDNNRRFRIEAPDQEGVEVKSNTDIRKFGRKFEVRIPKKQNGSYNTRKRALTHPTLEQYEFKLVSELIQARNSRINLFWLSAKPAVQLQYFFYLPEIVNKFQKTTFCSKLGLWTNFQKYVKFPESIMFPVQYPRMYNPGNRENRREFYLDFYLTACTSVLKWVVTNMSQHGVIGVMDAKGNVPVTVVEFACKKCQRYVSIMKRRGEVTLEEFAGDDHYWSHFLYWYYAMTVEGDKFRAVTPNTMFTVTTKATDTLRLLRQFIPNMKHDGIFNLWIVKPYSAACGRGIFITNNINYIDTLLPRYIVQKYIEKPFLIEGTKFDIRQWFMVTNLAPLEVWMYKECYLRFCTQPFDLRNLHPAVHLSNNAVQKKYIDAACLAAQNMWDSKTFQIYLKLIGFPDIWEERIYPGMRDGIICALLHAQPTFDEQRDGPFEIYGADYMLTSNLKDGPWLIEINESPAMDPSTTVTARLCEQMLRDAVKVVVDKKRNNDADTGGWELIFRQQIQGSRGESESKETGSI